MMFSVGQKVVCIDSGSWISIETLAVTGSAPVLEGIYTVTGIERDKFGEFLSLAEFDPSCLWEARSFRPIVERKTDIGVFKAMLNPSQVTVDAMNLADFARELVK